VFIFGIVCLATKRILLSLFGLLCCLGFITSGTMLMFFDKLGLEKVSADIRDLLFVLLFFGAISSISFLGVWIWFEVSWIKENGRKILPNKNTFT